MLVSSFEALFCFALSNASIMQNTYYTEAWTRSARHLILCAVELIIPMNFLSKMLSQFFAYAEVLFFLLTLPPRRGEKETLMAD